MGLTAGKPGGGKARVRGFFIIIISAVAKHACARVCSHLHLEVRWCSGYVLKDRDRPAWLSWLAGCLETEHCVRCMLSVALGRPSCRLASVRSHRVAAHQREGGRGNPTTFALYTHPMSYIPHPANPPTYVTDRPTSWWLLTQLVGRVHPKRGARNHCIPK